MEKVIFQEIFEYPVKEFTTHLQKEENERILFSGKYGIGKTSFLTDFFSKDDVGKQYDVYHLFPVNYSIASNEDIIQYIKHDIILQLLEKGKTIDEQSTSYLQNLPKFILKNLDKVAEAFISMIPKIGKDVVDAYKAWQPLVTKFLEFHEKNNISDGDRLVEYLDNHLLSRSGIFENDIITKIIVNMVRYVGEKKTVLIVDDLDRLDPEHVFRIMNVFAAHFDNKNYVRLYNDGQTVLTNKFGFDKIILVCDFLNIESLFHHRFGPEVDFNGYADKFYSLDVFHFDNKTAIFSVVKNVVKQLISNNTADEGEFQYYNRRIGNPGYLEGLLGVLIVGSAISLRNILKLLTVKIQWGIYIKLDNGIKFKVESIPVAVELKIIRDCIGDAKMLLNTFSICKRKEIPISFKDDYLGFLLWLAALDDYKDVRRDRKVVTFKGTRLQLAPNTSGIDDVNNILVHNIIDETNGNVKEGGIYQSSYDDFWDALLLVTKKFIEMGYLK
ncbi:hypothetical protein D3H65_00545 [Paraflavitalea soli]|uniref:NB-ARC domain-containing protein n=1 Tax=Paraflavitalea soli TaxID=2315862 RepID=A0A3B7ME12_9BACT|nr:NB-ARC domain-containing protein [Paraflavitalea soli]AXY72554.1 hypothetical protein D3H65_00545 [Paraflavitalea soli]